MLFKKDKMYTLASDLQPITLSCMYSVWDCIRPVLHTAVPRDCELAHLQLVDLGTLRLAETSKGYPRITGVLQKLRLRKRVRAVLQSTVPALPL
jgi:hypothetical protein